MSCLVNNANGVLRFYSVRYERALSSTLNGIISGIIRNFYISPETLGSFSFKQLKKTDNRCLPRSLQWEAGLFNISSIKGRGLASIYSVPIPGFYASPAPFFAMPGVERSILSARKNISVEPMEKTMPISVFDNIFQGILLLDTNRYFRRRSVQN